MRTLGFSIKGIGITGKVVHRMMTKQAFMQLGKRNMLHAGSAPPLADPYRAAWQKSHGTNLSWSTRISGKTKKKKKKKNV